MDPYIFADSDSDPKSQNLADRMDPADFYSSLYILYNNHLDIFVSL